MWRLWLTALLFFIATQLAWASPEDDLVKKILDAHSAIKSAQIDVTVRVTGDVPFKGTQVCTMTIQRPSDLVWKSHADMKDMQLDVQVMADGKEVVLYNSGDSETGEKNVYYRRPFNDDVLTLAGPINMGVQTLVLRLMSGNRETFLAMGADPNTKLPLKRTLRIPSTEPKDGQYMLELVAPDESVDQLYFDAKTYLMTHLTAQVKPEGSAALQEMAQATVTFDKLGATFEPSVFRFVPPPGAKPGITAPTHAPSAPAEKE